MLAGPTFQLIPAMKCALVPVTAYQQNCSVLICEETKRAALVDPGGDLPHLRAALEELGVTLEKVFLTHGHADHCGAADAVRKEFGVPVEGPQREDKFWIEQLPDACRRMGFPVAEAFEPDRWLDDGDSVSFGAQTLDVLHCPGHTPGHVVFFHRGERLALVGDVLFKGSIGRSDFPRGDHATLIASIEEKLLPLGEDVLFVPGHGPTSTFGEERRSNPYLAR
jgi:hydroxyacylglutathione hydrolase